MCVCIQREIANSYASNADYVHKTVLVTEEGRKRYAEQVSSNKVAEDVTRFEDMHDSSKILLF